MRKFLAVLLCLTLILPTATFAHSGRTDANGGHWDEENGDYHYHHGYEAHYHPGGVCPYDDTVETESAPQETEEEELEPSSKPSRPHLRDSKKWLEKYNSEEKIPLITFSDTLKEYNYTGRAADGEVFVKSNIYWDGKYYLKPNRTYYSNFSDYLDDAEDIEENLGFLRPNRDNYSEKREYNSDFLLVYSHTVVIKNGAYNFGLDYKRISDLTNDIKIFSLKQKKLIKNGNTEEAEKAYLQIEEYREELATLVLFREASCLYLTRYDIGYISSPLVMIRKKQAMREYRLHGKRIHNFGADVNRVYGLKRDSLIIALDERITYLSNLLNDAECAWTAVCG